ncbi:MAG: hypothetical protein JWO74_3357 [Solirubrobacterales bacterium]|jgi:hypothetical protein|nr:hypothetical protein [Solirubrobacterales bacterium]
MPHSEAHAWWADVQHLREPIERRRAEATRAERSLAEADRAPATDLQPLADPAFTTGGTPLPRRPRAAAASASPSARRTVQITGRTVPAPFVPRLVDIERRRPARRPATRVGPRPDRLAMWAVLLGFFLILVAATSSSHAATFPVGAQRHAPLVSHETRHGHLAAAVSGAPRLHVAH